jgi:ribosome-associated translation inhibitor RaiA
MLKMLDEKVKKQFGSWTAFANLQGENSSNFKRKIEQNISRINKWLKPAGMQIQIVLEKQKRAGKKNKNTSTTND